MSAEADVGRREAEAGGDLFGRRRRRAFLRQAGQGEGRRKRLAAAVAGDADDVADPLLQHQAQILGGEHLRRAQMGDERRRADGRMAGERQLATGGEDAQRRGVYGIARREHEYGLGQVELARDRLHPRVVEAVGVEHDGERVAGERRLGEHVEKAIGAAHGEPLGDACSADRRRLKSPSRRAKLAQGARRRRRCESLPFSAAVLIAFAGAAGAQTAPSPAASPPSPPPYGAPIGLARAENAIAAAVAEAVKRGWTMNVAVVDSGANLVAFARMDGVAARLDRHRRAQGENRRRVPPADARVRGSGAQRRTRVSASTASSPRPAACR